MGDPGYELAEALLEQLNLPPGTANAFVDVRGGDQQDQLVVWLGTGAKLPSAQRPKSFAGLDVVYKKRRAKGVWV